MDIPQELKVFLIDKDPLGLTEITVSNWSGRAYSLYRTYLDSVDFISDDYHYIYFLFGNAELNNKWKLYIGESQDIKTRIKDHANKKTFWHRCLLFSSIDGSLDSGMAKYLENDMYVELTSSDSFELDQKTPTGSRIQPYTALIYKKYIYMILGVFGYNVAVEFQRTDEITEGEIEDVRNAYNIETIIKKPMISASKQFYEHFWADLMQSYQLELPEIQLNTPGDHDWQGLKTQQSVTYNWWFKGKKKDKQFCAGIYLNIGSGGKRQLEIYKTIKAKKDLIQDELGLKLLENQTKSNYNLYYQIADGLDITALDPDQRKRLLQDGIEIMHLFWRHLHNFLE